MTQPEPRRPRRAPACRRTAQERGRRRPGPTGPSSRWKTAAETVNFNTVAVEASVSNRLLCSNTQLRSLIIEKRPGRRAAATPAAQRTSEASALVKLAVATEALRNIRLEVGRLRQENAALRGELLATRRNTLNGARWTTCTPQAEVALAELLQVH